MDDLGVPLFFGNIHIGPGVLFLPVGYDFFGFPNNRFMLLLQLNEVVGLLGSKMISCNIAEGGFFEVWVEIFWGKKRCFFPYFFQT